MGLFHSPPRSDIYLLGADGSGLRQLTHLGDAASPVFSADGRSIFFVRGHALTVASATIKRDNSTIVSTAFVIHTSLWQVGIDGTGLRRLTPKSKTTSYLPLSVSPVTGDLAYSREVCRHRKCRGGIRLLSPATGADTLLVAHADQVAFSPDGRELALSSNRDHNWPKHPAKHNALAPASELYVLDLSTGDLRRLIHTSGVLEGAPSWDPSGQRIAYIRFGLGGSRLMEVNADGSCHTGLFERPTSLFSPLFLGDAWEPGIGHEAARIAC